MDKDLKVKLKKALADRNNRLDSKDYEANVVDLMLKTIDRANIQAEILKEIADKELPKDFKINNFPKDIEINNLKELDGITVEVVNQLEEIKISNPQKEVEIKGEVKMAKPAWYKNVNEKSIIVGIVKGLITSLKAVTLQVTADKHKLPAQALAVKIVDKKGRYVDLTQQQQQLIRAGGGTSGGGGGDATEATQLLVLAELQTISSELNIYVDNEIPSGVIDGVNDTFTTAYNYKTNTTKVFLNGVRQSEGALMDYYENGSNQIVFNSPPQTNDTIIIDYIKN